MSSIAPSKRKLRNWIDPTTAASDYDSLMKDLKDDLLSQGIEWILYPTQRPQYKVVLPARLPFPNGPFRGTPEQQSELYRRAKDKYDDNKSIIAAGEKKNLKYSTI
jgi:hypothetical protein